MIQKMVRNERKIQILQALHECMLEKHFHQTSIKNIAKKAAERLSLTVLAIAEGLSRFSIFFNRNQLCTEIDCCKLLQSLVSENDLKFE